MAEVNRKRLDYWFPVKLL